MVPYCLNLEIGLDVFDVRFPATLKSAQEADLRVREKKHERKIESKSYFFSKKIFARFSKKFLKLSLRSTIITN